MTDSVICERHGAVLLITLNRPKANAIDALTSHAMGEAFVNFANDPSLSVAVVTGSGERFFSAGWDLKAAAEGEAVDADFGRGGFAGLTELWDLDKPVIAAVNGYAAGGGFELALAADLIIAANHAQFFLPEATLGIIPDSGGVLRGPGGSGKGTLSSLVAAKLGWHLLDSGALYRIVAVSAQSQAIDLADENTLVALFSFGFW